MHGKWGGATSYFWRREDIRGFGEIIFQTKFVFELMINLERNRKRSEEETVRLKNAVTQWRFAYFQ